jgi:hypothetical protein
MKTDDNIFMTVDETTPNSKAPSGWNTFLTLDHNSGTSHRTRTEIMIKQTALVTGNLEMFN